MKIGNIDPLVGRHFVAGSLNFCEIERIVPGAIRVHWNRKPTAGDTKEFERFVEGILGPGMVATINRDPDREAAEYEAWKKL